MNSNKLKELLGVAAVLLIATVLIFAGIYRCPFRFFLGIPCPTCGMTRALTALVKGDISGAFYYHPLWPLVPVVITIYILCLTKVIRPSVKVRDAAVIFLALIIMICFVLRHIYSSPVVKPDIESSFIWKILHYQGFNMLFE